MEIFEEYCDWSELYVELLTEIMNRLEIVDLIRAGSVCRSWRSCIGDANPKKCEIPWLMLSSPEEPEYRYFHDMNTDRFYKFSLPSIKNHNFIGSSKGYLISVDDAARVHATNPITHGHILLPDPTTLPFFEGVVCDSTTGKITAYLIGPGPDLDDRCVKQIRNHYYLKMLLIGSDDDDLDMELTAVLIHGAFCEIAFARATDHSWTPIAESPPVYNFVDVIFHKGLLYAVGYGGDLVIFDFGTLPPVPIVIRKDIAKGCEDSTVICYLVESPCREHLFLITRSTIDVCPNEEDEDYSYFRTTNFMVFILNEDTYDWIQVKSFAAADDDDDDAVAFLGFNRAVLVSTRHYPNNALISRRRNCIYFTDDSTVSNEAPEEVGLDMGVFNIEDAKVMPLDHIDALLLKRFNFPPPIWFTPAY